MHVSELQHLQMTIQALQDELRTQRDLNHLLQQESGNRSASEHFTTIELTEENFRRLQAEHDRQAKELFLLRKTLEEMELRIETQKQTLGARDESIKKLLEMLQSKGLPPGPGRASEEEEQERARRIAEAEAQLGHLEVILDQKEKENIHLREVLYDQGCVDINIKDSLYKTWNWLFFYFVITRGQCWGSYIFIMLYSAAYIVAYWLCNV